MAAPSATPSCTVYFRFTHDRAGAVSALTRSPVRTVRQLRCRTRTRRLLLLSPSIPCGLNRSRRYSFRRFRSVAGWVELVLNGTTPTTGVETTCGSQRRFSDTISACSPRVIFRAGQLVRIGRWRTRIALRDFPACPSQAPRSSRLGVFESAMAQKRHHEFRSRGNSSATRGSAIRSHRFSLKRKATPAGPLHGGFRILSGTSMNRGPVSCRSPESPSPNAADITTASVALAGSAERARGYLLASRLARRTLSALL
jgi:hypothetical protein